MVRRDKETEETNRRYVKARIELMHSKIRLRASQRNFFEELTQLVCDIRVLIAEELKQRKRV